jgi:hypothetical protein
VQPELVPVVVEVRVLVGEAGAWEVLVDLVL